MDPLKNSDEDKSSKNVNKVYSYLVIAFIIFAYLIIYFKLMFF